ncbi:MAG: PEP-CTERM sorting domain-containing protein [Kiritimatiellae bacterium]|nr:PEP-CTERM sorting domain-containing protein [Kiritimatiellia bacterium]
MKKLIVLLGLALMAVSAKAATANWMVDLGTDTYDTWSFYVFNGTQASTLANYLTTGKIAEFNTEIANYGSSAVALDSGYAEDGISNVGEAISALLYNSLEPDATFYYIASASTEGYTYAPPASAPDQLYWELTDFAEGTVGSSEVVPEPTSGLLMLLGLAGLALKRKKA